MIINRFIILDNTSKAAISFEFGEKANVICSDKNTSGKSCLIKSLYYSLGLDIKKFAPKWNYTDMIFKVYFTHKNGQGWIVRSKDKYWVHDQDFFLVEREYSEWLQNLLGISIKLQYKKEGENEVVYPSSFISLFYLDQDTSWSGTPYKHTVSQDFYAQSAIPGKVFDQALGFRNERLDQLENQIINNKNDLDMLRKQQEAIRQLSEKFTQNGSATTYEFDETAIKQEIQLYLREASRISNEIITFKANIYSKQVEMDALLSDAKELEKIIQLLGRTYTNIKNRCTQCDSFLTIEQSIKRLKVEDNKISAAIKKQAVDREIELLRGNLQDLQNQTLGLEKEHSKLLSLAETKNNDVTLGQYIKDKAAQQAKSLYLEMKTDLYGKIETLEEAQDEIQKEKRKLGSELKKLKKQSESLFVSLKFDFKSKFNDIQLDDYKFLQFKQINDSGAAKNKV